MFAYFNWLGGHLSLAKLAANVSFDDELWFLFFQNPFEFLQG